MVCPSCHTPNRDTARYCKRCGQELAIETVIAAPAPPAGGVQFQEGAATQHEQREAQEFQQNSTSASAVSAATQMQQQEQKSVISSPENNPVAQAAPAQNRQPDVPDISQAPTQILTPNEMMAYHTRRWQEELEHVHPSGELKDNVQVQRTSQEAHTGDIADAPTRIFSPVSPTSSAVTTAQQDVADAPTLLIPQQELNTATAAVNTSAHQGEQQSETTKQGAAEAILQEVAGKQEKQPASSTASTASQTEQVVSGHEAQEAQTAKTEASAETTFPSATPDVVQEATSKTIEEEQNVEQPGDSTVQQEVQLQTSQESQQSQEKQEQQKLNAASPFPVLAVGTLVGERYEIVQVVSQEEHEHVYEVRDHKGYLHCWNCGSEENGEGDEFCIDCGAELLNASYILHEYPAGTTGQQDAHVLQGTIVNTFVAQGQTYLVEQLQSEQSLPNGVSLLAASASDAGDMRRTAPNEDSTLVLSLQRVHESLSSPAGIFLVSDGMGGHDKGQVASRITATMIAERVLRELLLQPLEAKEAQTEQQQGEISEQTKEMDEESLLKLLQSAIEDANTTVCQVNQRNKSDMGATLTGFMISEDRAYIFNVGDSRTYMLRDRNLYQLTNDHSLVGQLVAGGLIAPEDVYTHPQRSQIYRSIGDKLNVQIDLFKQQIHPGDMLLSCSDGLWEMVRDNQIADILNAAPDPQTACMQLIEAANANGGEDNVSAVLVFVR